MNARQRRWKRRVVAPAVEVLASAMEQAALTGVPMQPDEMKQIAELLREMLRGEGLMVSKPAPGQGGG